MARLPNEALMRMSPQESRAYIALHPAEAKRFAKLYAGEARYHAAQAIRTALSPDREFLIQHGALAE